MYTWWDARNRRVVFAALFTTWLRSADGCGVECLLFLHVYHNSELASLSEGYIGVTID